MDDWDWFPRAVVWGVGFAIAGNLLIAPYYILKQLDRIVRLLERRPPRD